MVAKKLKGVVFNIQRYSIHDGEGIRTLVFMKGCPLKCQWCANPEGLRFQPALSYIERKCIGCGKCKEVCLAEAISYENGKMIWHKEKCSECMNCVNVCIPKARDVCGTEYTISDLIKVIERDRPFFRRSGGGLTIGGGEPLYQGEFVSELIKKASDANIHTAIETSSFGKWEYLSSIVDNIDTLFMDVKHMNSKIHEEITAVPNELILDNIRKTAEKIKGTEKILVIRIPVIPGKNDSEDNIRATADFAKSLGVVKRLELLPYHYYGESKYVRTKWTEEYQLHGLEPLCDEEMNKLKGIVEEYGIRSKIGG
ncbi:MAG TPA: glycyl-radical enzyme activating protein [Anaerovoracaceae bacterium]|nr:glycyl-radical enzyme activating protein [Anaerovoracaceae bacterium]